MLYRTIDNGNSILQQELMMVKPKNTSISSDATDLRDVWHAERIRKWIQQQ